jgi:hypothetical protein
MAVIKLSRRTPLIGPNLLPSLRSLQKQGPRADRPISGCRWLQLDPRAGPLPSPHISGSDEVPCGRPAPLC